VASVNVDRGVYDSRLEVSTYRRAGEYNPLESVQNRPGSSASMATSDIDKKI
jgi:hypothetical protein